MRVKSANTKRDMASCARLGRTRELHVRYQDFSIRPKQGHQEGHQGHPSKYNVKPIHPDARSSRNLVVEIQRVPIATIEAPAPGLSVRFHFLWRTHHQFISRLHVCDGR